MKNITRAQYFRAVKVIDTYGKQRSVKDTHDLTAMAIAVEHTWAKSLKRNMYYCQHCQEEANVNYEVKHKKDCIVVTLSKYLHGVKVPIKK